MFEHLQNRKKVQKDTEIYWILFLNVPLQAAVDASIDNR